MRTSIVLAILAIFVICGTNAEDQSIFMIREEDSIKYFPNIDFDVMWKYFNGSKIPDLKAKDGLKEMDIYDIEITKINYHFAFYDYATDTAEDMVYYVKMTDPFDFEMKFGFIFTYLVVPISGSGTITGKATDATYQLQIKDKVIPSLDCKWAFDAPVLKGIFKKAFKIPELIQTCFTDGMEKTLMPLLNDVLGTYVSDYYMNTLYPAPSLVTHYGTKEITLSTKFLAFTVDDKSFSVSYVVLGSPDEIVYINNPKALARKVSQQLRNKPNINNNDDAREMRNFAFSPAAMSSFLGAIPNITDFVVTNDDIKEHTSFLYLDYKSFQKVMPDLYMKSGVNKNLKVEIIGMYQPLVPVETTVEGAMKFTGLINTLNFYDEDDEKLANKHLNAIVNITFSVHPVINVIAKQTMLQFRMSFLSLDDVQLKRAEPNPSTSTILKDGLQEFLEEFIEGYIIEKFGDQVLGTGIVWTDKVILFDNGKATVTDDGYANYISTYSK